MARRELPTWGWRTRGPAFRQKTCRIFGNASTRGVRTRRTPWPAAVWVSRWPRKSSRRIGGGSGSKATWAKGRRSTSPCPWPGEEGPHEPDDASLRRALAGIGAHLARVHFSAQRYLLLFAPLHAQWSASRALSGPPSRAGSVARHLCGDPHLRSRALHTRAASPLRKPGDRRQTFPGCHRRGSQKSPGLLEPVLAQVPAEPTDLSQPSTLLRRSHGTPGPRPAGVGDLVGTGYAS